MDIECPYCEESQNINHDDGFGYEECVKHEMCCEHCSKNFVFETSIIFHYEAEKADCLNGGNHDYKRCYTAPVEFTTMECNSCGSRRELTQSERAEFGIGSVEDYLETLN